jgi:hypothetical protein
MKLNFEKPVLREQEKEMQNSCILFIVKRIIFFISIWFLDHSINRKESVDDGFSGNQRVLFHIMSFIRK